MGIPRFQRFITKFSLLMLVGVLGVLSACRSEKKAGETTPLEERVKAFWDARVAGDDLKAYNYEIFAKNGEMSASQYVRARTPTLRYKSYQIKKIEVQGDQATITMDLYYQLIIPTRSELPLSMERTEKWLRLEDGQWYREIKKQKGFPGAQEKEPASPS
jgi:hypothetical protein